MAHSHSPSSDEEDEAVEILPPAPANSPTAACIPSTCTSTVAKMEANRYKVPTECALLAPNPDQRAHAPPPGYAVIYIHHFRKGLRLPLPPFVAAVLEHYQIALAQLHPNCIKTLLGFVAVCMKASVSPTAPLFRHFFQLRKNSKTEGWYNFRAKEPKMCGQASSARGWKKSFLFFKNGNVSLSWNFSPDMDPMIPENERPDDEAVRKILDHFKGSPGRESAAVDQIPLGSEEEEIMVIREDGKMTSVSNSWSPKKARKATMKPKATSTEPPCADCRPKRMAESLATKPAKTLKGATGKKCEVPTLPILHDSDDTKITLLKTDIKEKESEIALLKVEVAAMKLHVKDKDNQIASLKADLKDRDDENAWLKAKVSRLQGTVDDRGPLLRSYTRKLLQTQGFANYIIELGMLIKSLGHHEAAEQIRTRFPAIPEEALVGLEDPLASYKADSKLYEMQNGAFQFPLLDHLMSLEEIPTSSELKDLDVDEDKGALIAPSPPHSE